MTIRGVRPIVVYGATGYTGRLVASELHQHAMRPFVLAGRDAEKLEALREQLGDGPGPEVRIEVAELDGVASLLTRCEAVTVINCAGPFSVCGEPVVRAAVEAGAQYIDTTGEQAFMRAIFSSLEAETKKQNVAVVCAVGLNCLPGDLAARLAARALEPLDEMVLSYDVQNFRPSLGSVRAVLAVLTSEWVTYRDGLISAVPNSLERRRIAFPRSRKGILCVTYPSGEVLTVPRHTTVRNVTTLINSDASIKLGPLTPLGLRLFPLLRMLIRTRFGRALRTIVPYVGRIARRGRDGPSAAGRHSMRFTIRADASGSHGHRSIIVEGRDTYGLTAVSVVHAANLVSDPSYGKVGVLAPAEAFDPDEFLSYLRARGKIFEVR